MPLAVLVFLPLFAGPAVYALGRETPRGRDLVVTVLACAEAALSLSLFLTPGASWTAEGVLLSGLSFRADGFRAVYSVVTSLLWLGTGLSSLEYFREERAHLDAYWMFTMVTLGATQGVMLSADLMTTFVFFEIVSLASFTWVIHERTAEAVYAGYTYLFLAVGGGLILFLGLALLSHACGTLSYADLREAVSAVRGTEAGRSLLPAGICILLGFGAKAGMFPLHVWLPMAHPVAPSPASALLSGVLTKVGVYGVLMCALEVLWDDASFGWTVLLLGLVTMALGAVLALFSAHLKRTLACSSMSQIGFILVGIGTMVLARAHGGDEAALLAWSGTVLHMVNHSLFKLILFLCAGVVLVDLHTLRLDEIQGYGRRRPVLKAAFALAGLGIGGVPLLNGYVSKTLLHEGLVELMEAADLGTLPHVAEWVFLISGGCTFAYMLKLFVCVFVERNADPTVQARYDARPSRTDRLSLAVPLTGAILCVPLGQPWIMVRLAGIMTGERLGHFSAFAWGNLKGGLISLGIGAAVYLIVVRTVLRPGGRYADRWPAVLDLERGLYRPLATRWLPGIFGTVLGLFGRNAVLGPVCRGLVWLGTLCGRILGDSMDALVVLLRRTLVREERPRDGSEPLRVSRMRAFERASQEALDPLFENFSFALLMTCMGVIAFLGALVALLQA